MSANMMYTAISGLGTFNEALSVVSDNIANANTTAYKSQTVDFGNLVSGFMPTVYDNNTTSQGVGSSILSTASNQNTGTEVQTSLWSDLMLQGGGFFTVQNTHSNADYYTRDGSFEVNPTGYLTDKNGNEVLDGSGSPIQVEADPTNPVYSSYSIDQFGNLSGITSAGSTATIGQLGVTTFSNPSGLVSVGNNMFTTGNTGSNAGTAVVGTAGAGQAGTILSGALEGSNVDLTTQMVNMINFQADYQANSKSIVTANTLLQTVVNLIAG
ncbi:MAG: flagellar hook basal-body protein [Syntrophobacteraceae bacterium]|nr:flagellar hook basal-body protein [Syntrophobacteraceae bacterium]